MIVKQSNICMIERIPQKTGRILINIAALLFLFIPPLVRAMPDVVLAEDKQPRSAIIVAPEILTPLLQTDYALRWRIWPVVCA